MKLLNDNEKGLQNSKNFGKTLIIYAHPNTKGHSPIILDEVKKKLKEIKQDYEVIDLYKINYDPVLHEDEHYTAGNYNVSKQNKEFQKKIKQTKKLIFIYPIWWNSTPAIFKGFVDRVFTHRFAFVYKNKRPVGLLKDKKAVVIASSGAPKFFYWMIEKNIGLKQMTKYTLKFCGIKSKSFLIGNSSEFNDKQQKKIETQVGKALHYLYEVK
jgi:NAD(P)H dehydrogenase (quinone)